GEAVDGGVVGAVRDRPVLEAEGDAVGYRARLLPDEGPERVRRAPDLAEECVEIHAGRIGRGHARAERPASLARRGSAITIDVPPPAGEDASMCPPWSATSERAIARPTPRPLRAPWLGANGANSSGRVSRSIPGPSSATVTSAVAERATTRTRTVPSGGENLIALSRTAPIARARRAASP